jgi:eukaryotic-like serine/threonine-protein kinase
MRDAQRYQIKQLIAAGGMAEVYLGESAGIEGFRKKVAIKRVLPKLSENQEFINMFLDEARLCAYLSHSKCVQVFDIGQGAGTHFIVMEYVDGADLRGVLDYLASQGKAMTVEVACLIAMQICEGLAYAHSACDHQGNPLHIVHRDISPHNVLMTSYGEVKLVDFGLAKASSHLSDEDEDIVKGKFGYLAPEVTLRQGVDHRVDIFAAGILVYEMLTGRRLFQGKTDLETFKQVQAAQIPDVRQIRPDVDDQMLRVMLKALSRDRETRYQTAHEFARDLSQVLFSRGRAVSYLDIAQIVKSTAAHQQLARKKRPAKDAQAVIGELIIDTLHNFSATEDEPAPGLVGLKPHSPLSVRSPGKYEDPTAWGLGDDFGDLLDAPKPAAPSVPRAAPARPAATVSVPADSGTTSMSTKLPASQPSASVPSGGTNVSLPSPPTVNAPAPPQMPASAAAVRARMHSRVGTPTPGGPWWKRWF